MFVITHGVDKAKYVKIWDRRSYSQWKRL